MQSGREQDRLGGWGLQYPFGAAQELQQQAEVAKG